MQYTQSSMTQSQPNPTQKFPLPPEPRKNKGWRKVVRFIWIGLSLLIGGLALLFFAISQGFLGDMPDVRELENPDIFVSSEVYSADGVLLTKFEKEKTKPVTYQQLPKHLVYALQAKEDERFTKHSGIDLKSIGRALFFQGERGGGSTITQQLAKLLFTGRASQNRFQRVFEKLKEWVVAVSLEKRYTKEEIITLYFNKFDFVNNAKGIEMASKIYFNKSASQLSLPESATFVAMLEAPVKNNPLRNPTTSKERRDVVIKQMLEKGYIDQNAYSQAIAQPLVTDFHPIQNLQEDGYGAYYKYYLRKEIEGYLKEYEKKTGKSVNLYRDGLKIYTTLDSKLQHYAEESIREHMIDLQRSFDSEQRGRKDAPFYHINSKEIDGIMMQAVRRTGRYKQLEAANVSPEEIMKEFKTPTKLSRFTWKGEEEVEMSPWDSIRYHKQIAQAALLSMNPTTGEIKAWVGGIDWKHFQYDHIKQGKRQVGSTFKPFVYLAAIMYNNMTPCSSVSNDTYNKGGYKVPGRGGSLTLREALAQSQNPVAVRLMEMTGPNKVVQLAHDLGVTTKMPTNQLAVALGSEDISLYEMLGAYSTFANYGNYNKPEMVWRVEDANGRVIKETKPEIKEKMNELYAYTMIELMKGVADFGTASGELRRRGISQAVEIAGKTGTTQNNSDGWFIGITPKLATAVWVGWEDRSAHFYATGEGQGAKMALPIWAIFMKKIWADKSLEISPDDKFVKPADWSGGCGDLSGLKSGYGDEGGLQSYEEAKNPVIYEPKPTTGSSKKNNNGNSTENLNKELNKEDEVDFNQ